MFEIKPMGTWDQIVAIMRFRHKRAEALFHKATLDLAKAFKNTVAENIPDFPDADAYRKSLEIKRMLGAKQYEAGYAIISEAKEVSIRDVEKGKHVFYFIQTGEVVSDFGAFLEEYSPFVPSMFRLKASYLIRMGGIRLVHRRVTEDEFAKVAEKNKRDMEGNRARLKEAADVFSRDFAAQIKEIRLQKEKPPVKSMPDWMFLAIRMEFGINSPQQKHWSTAVQEAPKMAKELSAKNGRLYSRYIADARFKDWTMARKKLKGIGVQDFKKKYLEFQDKVSPR